MSENLHTKPSQLKPLAGASSSGSGGAAGLPKGSLSGKITNNVKWDDTIGESTSKLKDYDANEDPYNVYSRTKRLQATIQKDNEHIKVQKMLTSKSLDSLPPPETGLAGTAMKKMHRIEFPVEEPFPKYTLPNVSTDKSGMTISVDSSAEESHAELEVLKAILNRESYLSRLHASVRTIDKKFKAEIADVLDFIRAASVDVVEALVSWREVKKDHDCTFIWNGINYLLKMGSDLDFLVKYRAVNEWIGFSLVRNPFVVPLPLEHGVEVFAGKVLDPQHIEPGLPSDGFILGGLTHKTLRKKYTPAGKGSNKQSGGFGAVDKREISNSFVFNSDMRKIRQAELIILKEEEKFGALSRDPEGKLMPTVQAQTRIVASQLRRDDRRPIDQPSATDRAFAPHAAKSDVGLAATPWLPQAEDPDPYLHNDLLAASDPTVIAVKRGKDKVGGVLHSLQTQGVETRPRRMLPPTLGTGIEFSRSRKKKTLGERLNEIAVLKAAIEKEKEALARMAEMEKQHSKRGSRKNTPFRSPSRGLSRGSVRSELEEGDDEGKRPTTSLSFSERSSDLGQGSLGELRGTDGEESVVVEGRDGAAPEELSNSDDVLMFSLSQESKVSSNNFDFAVIDSTASNSKHQAIDGQSPSIAPTINVSSSIFPNMKKVKEGYDEYKELVEEENLKSRQLYHLEKDQAAVDKLKIDERKDTNSERSREIERKRRLLTKEEANRTGPPKEEGENVYDYFAIKVQSCIRGWLARCWFKWFVRASSKAAICIEAGMRGSLVRMRIAKYKKIYNSATNIQKVFRGYKARNVSAKLAKNKYVGKSALVIQRCYRGHAGRNRSKSKLQLDRAARAALKAVDARSLFASDAKELARRILCALEEPDVDFPPDEVLHMIRLAFLIIQGARGLMGFSEYDFINMRHYREADGATLNWEEAGKMVNRSERFIRLLRVLAHGPGAKPPRLILIPESAKLLHNAMRGNPKWKLETFEGMGTGSKLCSHLFTWVEGIIDVATRQQSFLTFIATSFPDWLRELNELQASSRSFEFNVAINSRCIDIISGFMKANPLDTQLNTLLVSEINKMEKIIFADKEQQAVVFKGEEKVKHDQAKREAILHATMHNKLLGMVDELTVIANKYKGVAAQAMNGDQASQKELPQVRADLTHKELEVNEYRTRFKVLGQETASNDNSRRKDGRLASDIRAKAYVAGENMAKMLIAASKCQVFLTDAGVKWRERLDSKHLPAFNVLAEAEAKFTEEMKVSTRDANLDRKAYDQAITDKLNAAQLAAKSGAELISPNDAEMEEERREDEILAKAELQKLKQYLPESVKECLPRPRPVMICIARDISAFLKRKIIQEITKYMPGMYINLDIPGGMGLDPLLIQEVLDSKHSVILSIDQGLTEVTRSNFLKSLEMCMNCLVPVPFIVMAVGCEGNLSSHAGTAFGVGKEDLMLMRDLEIKSALEVMSYVIHAIQQSEQLQRMQVQSTDIVPTSASLVLVLEALFVILSDHDDFFSPDKAAMGGSTWRLTQRLLADPVNLARKLKSRARGSTSLRRCECLNQYMLQRHWPPVGNAARVEDPTLNLLASYIEKWLVCEMTTIQRGGAPKLPLTKNIISGVQTVVIVTDNVSDPEDLYGANTNSGWRMPAAKIVRICLQDMRVIKTVTDIDEEKYNVCVYREGSYVYFDAYDPVTSQVYLAYAGLSEIPNLLIPNAFSINAGIKIDPPRNQVELGQRLIRLLTFEKSRNNKDARKVLICKRDYLFLQNVTEKRNGHLTHIKAYEAAIGQLWFKVYLPQCSATASVLMEDGLRLKLLKNHDMELEHHVVAEKDAKLMLPYILDRLRVTPSIRILKSKEFELFDGYQKTKEGMAALVKAQGFQMKVRVAGGAGKLLYTRVHKFSEVPHIIAIRSCTVAKMLRLMVYEPRTRQQMELRVNRFMRKLIFHTDSDDCRMWNKTLLERLKIGWRGEKHSLKFDSSILRVVRRISGKRVVLRLIATDETSLLVKITDTSTSVNYSTLLNKEQLMRLLCHLPDADIVKRDFNLEEASNSVRSMLVKSMESSKDIHKSMKEEKKNLEEEKQIIDPALFQSDLIEVLSNHENLTNLASKLQILLRHNNDASGQDFFYTIEPVDAKLVFHRVPEATNKAELNTALRSTPRLAQFELQTLSPMGVVRQRRQMKIMDMDIELNALALKKSLFTRIKIQEIVKSTEDIQEYMDTLEPEEKDEVIAAAATTTATDIMDKVEQKIVTRMVERAQPGATQELRRQLQLMSADGKTTVEVDEDMFTEEQRAILGRGEKLVCEAGVKCGFRSKGSRWAGHVSIKVHETLCWQSPEEGCGRRLRFTVFDPNTSCYYEGFIRNSRHLKEILGVSGLDLMDQDKTTDMILFIAKFRLYLMSNETTWDGQAAGEGAPAYRVEFDSVRIYDNSKITPVNAAGEVDADANKDKLIDLVKLRGRKLLRLARRVSGLLMQLTVFELPLDEAAPEEVEDPLKNATYSLDDMGNPVIVVPSTAEEGEEPSDNNPTLTPEIPHSKSSKVERHSVPTLRVIAYDPRSRRKVYLVAPPPMLLELAGGVHSSYLAPRNRRELAKILCEALLLFFPRGQPFELTVNWSGSRTATNAMVTGDETKTKVWRSSADRVVKRPGKIFRSAMRISKLELLVTFYVQTKVVGVEGDNSSLHHNADHSGSRLICNFYSTSASEATEVLVSEDDQIKRIGKTILSLPDGPVRSTAIRRFCHFFTAALQEDPDNMTKKILHIDFAKPKKDFVNEYRLIGIPPPGDDIRPVGIPECFLPLDTCGRMLHRRGMTLTIDLDMNNIKGKKREDMKEMKDFVVSVYTKSPGEEPEKGLIIKLYERGQSDTLIMHIGPNEVYRLADESGEPDLLKDIVNGKVAVDSEELDHLEKSFLDVTNKGELTNERNKLINMLMDIVLNQLGVSTTAQEKYVPFIRSYKRGQIPM